MKKGIRFLSAITAALMLFLGSNVSADAAISRTLKQGMSGSDVRELQNNLRYLGYFSSSSTGYFGQVTRSSVYAFQRVNGLETDGIVGPKTIAALGEVTAAKSRGAVAMDWLSEARYVFPRGAVAKVTDVYTGKSFYIKRTFGENHADCEALTYWDSQKIKEIWGGWSWVRRPIVVEVNKKRIAASMAAMPHAGLDAYPARQVIANRSGNYGTGPNLDLVKGNGMDGHFDVHFLNSRTHGSNRVDPNHQAAVRQAIGK